MIIGKLIRYLTALVGVAVLLPAIFPNMAAIAAEHLAAATDPPNQACTRSTRSIRQLAMIDHTSDGGFQCLGVSVEGDTVKAIRLERHVFASAVGQPAAEQIKIVEFPATILDSLRGAVIDGIPGHDAIVLRGHFSAPPDKGEFEISYLYNGLTGEYHRCQIELDRTPNTGWRLVNRLDQTISLIMVKLRQIPVIGTVGIDNLEGACT
jgi:hypothetical protein